MKTTPNIAPVSANGQPTPTTTGTTPVAKLIAQAKTESVRTDQPADETPTPPAAEPLTLPSAKPIAPPAPEPIAPVTAIAIAETKSVTERIAERHEQLRQMTQTVKQRERLTQIKNDLDNFNFNLNNDDERNFDTIVYRDDRRASFTVRNATLCTEQIAQLKARISQKYEEKQQELLQFSL